jgi:serine/threonine protein kinase
MDRPDELGSLPTGDWGRLKDLADRCEQAWQQAKATGGAVDLNALLPAKGDPLRSAALYELIKIDMEFRWLRGQIITLDYYLETFPEIGPADKVSPRLIYEEYRLSQLHGVNTPLPVYQKRFPRQFDELQRLIEEATRLTRASSDMSSSSGPSSATVGSGLASNNPLGSSHGAGALVGGGYRLEKRIGSGAFGEVWRATAPGGVEVAVKIIFRPLDNEEAKSELQAMELIKTLRHPFLLQTHAFWPEQDRLLIVMELADGSLRDRLKQCKKVGLNGIPVKELLTYFREAAEALDYLHGRRLLHRDIKPDNILLLEHHAKVADFGLARIMSTRRSAKVTGSGTPAYMAPEMWASQVNQYSDQYCLATTYAELRLAKSLFQGQDIIQLMRAHLQETPDLSTLPAREAQILHRALAKDPLKRFGSCGEFVEALTDVAQTGKVVRRDVSHIPAGASERQAPAPHPGQARDEWKDEGTLHPSDLEPETPAHESHGGVSAIPDTDARDLPTLAAASDHARALAASPPRQTAKPSAPPSTRPPSWHDTGSPDPGSTAVPAREETQEARPWKPQGAQARSRKKPLLLGAAAAVAVLALLGFLFWNAGSSLKVDVAKLANEGQFDQALARIDQANFLTLSGARTAARAQVRDSWLAQVRRLHENEKHDDEEKSARDLLKRFPDDENAAQLLDIAVAYNIAPLMGKGDYAGAFQRLAGVNPKSKVVEDLHAKWLDQAEKYLATDDYRKAQDTAGTMLTYFKDDPGASVIFRKARYERVAVDVRGLARSNKYKEAFARVMDVPELSSDEINRLVREILEPLVERAERQFKAGDFSKCQQTTHQGLDNLGAVSPQLRGDAEQKLSTLLVLSWARDSKRDEKQSEAILDRFRTLLTQDSGMRGKELAAAFIDVADKVQPQWRKQADLIRPVLAGLPAADARPIEEKLNAWRNMTATGDLLARARTLFEQKDYQGSLECLRETLDKGTGLGTQEVLLVLALARVAAEQGQYRNPTLEILGKMSGLPRAQKDQVEGYTAFLQGLSHQEQGQLAEAAEDMMHAYAQESSLAPAWAKQSADLLQKAASDLPRSENAPGAGLLSSPFKPGDADKAFRWLDKAQQLLAAGSGDPRRALPEPAQVKLALAANFKADSDTRPARQLADEVIAQDQAGKLGLDALALLLIRARTPDEGAIGAYAAIEKHFKLKKLEKRGLDAKTWFTTVLQPAVTLGDRQANPQQKSKDFRTALARCYASYARFLHEHLYADEGEGQKWIPANPKQKVFDYYVKAVALDDTRADYWTGYAYSRTALPPVDWAEVKNESDKALALGPQSPAAFGLRGYVFLLESRRERDLKKRVEELRQADQALEQALALAKKKKDDEDTPTLLLNRSITDLELGNYIAALPERKQFLYAARDLAEQATKVEHPYPEFVQEAWGNALEDIAMFFGETKAYDDAVDKFTNVIKSRPYLAHGYVCRGRVLYRWAADNNKGAASLDRDDVKRLTGAERDLKTGIKYGPKSRDAAEAYYWKGMIGQKRNDMASAVTDFAEAIVVGWKHGGRDWAENAWIAFSRPQDRIKLGGEVARLLQQPKTDYNQNEAACLLAKACLVRGLGYEAQGKNSWPQALEMYDQGLAGRPQGVDKVVGQLLLNRAHLQLNSQAQVTRADILKNLTKAVKLLPDTSDKASALALVSLVNFLDALDANAENPQQSRTSAIAAAREAIKYAGANHPDWATMRYVLVKNLFPLAKETEDPKMKVQILDEAIERATQVIQRRNLLPRAQQEELVQLLPLLRREKSEVQGNTGAP